MKCPLRLTILIALFTYTHNMTGSRTNASLIVAEIVQRGRENSEITPTVSRKKKSSCPQSLSTTRFSTSEMNWMGLPHITVNRSAVSCRRNIATSLAKTSSVLFGYWEIARKRRSALGLDYDLTRRDNDEICVWHYYPPPATMFSKRSPR